MSARRHVLNALLNLLWTGVCLGPVYVFCSREVAASWLYEFAAAAVIVFVAPRVALQWLQLSQDTRVYRRLGVPLLVRFTQDAPWMRRLGGEAGPRVRREREAIARFTRETWMRERFHLGLFVFCAMCAGWRCGGCRLGGLRRWW